MRGDGRIFTRKGSPFFWISFYRHSKEHREVACNVRTGEKIRATEEMRKMAEKCLEDRVHKVADELTGGRPFVGSQAKRLTINDLILALELDLKLRGKASAQAISNLSRVRQDFGFYKAVRLTAEQVDQYVQQRLADGSAIASINRVTQLLSQSFNLAIERDRLAAKPHIRHLSEKGNERKGFMNRVELNRVIEHLPDYLRDVALFAFLSSWRRGEILSLKWTDVDGDTIRLRAEHSKEREARSLALEGELFELIVRRQMHQNGALVFHHNGRAITDMRKAWCTACRMAGVPERIFHDLRRSGIRDMIRAGVAPHVAMSISGHKTDSMLRRYAIINEADQRAALRRTQEFRAAEKESSITTTRVQ